METVLLYSPPGSPAYKSYIPTSEKAGIRFDLMPFSIGNSPIQLRLRETQEIPEITPAPAPEGDLNYSRSGYENLIDQTGKHIENKGWGKVVISRSQQYAVKNLDALQLFHALRRQYPNACVYLLQHASCGVWMGATPELLISGKRGLLQSMSLAGTRRKGEEHTFEPKEEEEQAIVTRYIRNVLQVQTGVANIRVSERDKLPAGDLIHFVNRISAEYGNTLDLDELLYNLHPTPAVGGWPKKEALAYIEDHEKHDRAYYSGYFGLRTKDSFAYYVNLRCMQVYNNAVVLYAGGGILADSDPVSEWEETEAKLQTLLRVIQSTNLYE